MPPPIEGVPILPDADIFTINFSAFEPEGSKSEISTCKIFSVSLV